jgi:hypothetical protein
MKYIIIYLFLIIFRISYTQIPINLIYTEEDCSIILLDKINEYRVKNGLNKLELDTTLTKACKHHCEYMSVYDIASHFETNSDSSHLIESISFPLDRVERFGENPGNMLKENCLNIGPMIFKDTSFNYLTRKWKSNISMNIIDTDISSGCVLQKWIESVDHNLTLLEKQATAAGIYQKIYINKSGKYKVVSALMITNKILN